MMAHSPNDPRSPLRKVFTVAERAVAVRVEPLVQGGGFANAMSRYVAINRRVGRTLSNVTGGVLHLVNIPTTTDVARLHEHLNAVDQQLSQLTREIEKGSAPARKNPAGRTKNRRNAKDPAQASEED